VIANRVTRLLCSPLTWLSVPPLLMLSCLLLAESADNVSTATYRTSVSEVRVTFFATDENNRAIASIGKDDFAIVDDDIVIREFRSLARASENALRVVVMVDTSQSVGSRLQEVMKNVVQSVVQKQGTTEDVSVVGFGGLEPVLMCAGNCGSTAVGQQLLAAKPAGTTPLFDALDYSAHLISTRRDAATRPALLVFSDGGDTVSKISAQDALESVIATGAPLYTIDLNEPGVGARGSSVLQQLAEATGGQHFFFQQGTVNALRVAEDDLRASYVVTYELPRRVIGFHSVHILPKHNPNLRFHCRRGYYYAADGPVTGGL